MAWTDEEIVALRLKEDALKAVVRAHGEAAEYELVAKVVLPIRSILGQDGESIYANRLDSDLQPIHRDFFAQSVLVEPWIRSVGQDGKVRMLKQRVRHSGVPNAGMQPINAAAEAIFAAWISFNGHARDPISYFSPEPIDRVAQMSRAHDLDRRSGSESFVRQLVRLISEHLDRIRFHRTSRKLYTHPSFTPMLEPLGFLDKILMRVI